MVKISTRVSRILPSGTLAMTQKARELKEKGRKVISLSIGEPDFNTPEQITDAAITALKNHETDHYTPALGIDSLRQAICDYHYRRDGIRLEKNQVATFSGAKFALYSVFMTLVDAGDEVLIPIPYWVSYAEQVQLAEGVPVYIETKEKNSFKVTIDLLNEYVTEKTKLLLLNAPSNPSGLLYTKDELFAIGNWALEHNIFVIADEIYYELVYGEDSISMASLSKEIFDNTLVVNGLSKSVAMTGWRLGYVFGPQKVIRALNDLTSHTTSNPAAVTQYAAIRAFDEDMEVVKSQMREKFQLRIDLFHQLLNEIQGIK
ncbi:pyridoxal phosphate-dependent aminotransferase, partial [Granulicatella adiacens]|uniref:pyridoxal phosphate-dependent aminotransferase n=1 Tax=Granulicatella adiacens TaxID=46124 RepID=UPI003C73CC30